MVFKQVIISSIEFCLFACLPQNCGGEVTNKFVAMIPNTHPRGHSELASSISFLSHRWTQQEPFEQFGWSIAHHLWSIMPVLPDPNVICSNPQILRKMMKLCEFDHIGHVIFTWSGEYSSNLVAFFSSILPASFHLNYFCF